MCAESTTQPPPAAWPCPGASIQPGSHAELHVHTCKRPALPPSCTRTAHLWHRAAPCSPRKRRRQTATCPGQALVPPSQVPWLSAHMSQGHEGSQSCHPREQATSRRRDSSKLPGFGAGSGREVVTRCTRGVHQLRTAGQCSRRGPTPRPVRRHTHLHTRPLWARGSGESPGRVFPRADGQRRYNLHI